MNRRLCLGILLAASAMLFACGNNEPDFGDTSIFEVGTESGPDLGFTDVLFLLGYDASARSPDFDLALGHAVNMATTRGTIRIAGYTEYADQRDGQEVEGTLDALVDVMPIFEADYAMALFDEDDDFETVLAAADVLLVFDQDTPFGSDVAGVGAAWLPVLGPWLTDGGVIIVMDRLQSTTPILDSPALIPVIAYRSAFTGTTLTVNPAALTSYGQSDPFVTDVGVMAYTPADGATFTWGLQDSFGNYPILYRRYACGDGVLDDGEECDEGDLNDDADGAPCRLLCTLPTCGDGYVDLGEECDDGNLSNSDECTVDCLETRCGDGIWQLGEECDDGNLDDGDACTSVCEFGPTYVPCFDVDLGSATGPSVAAGTTTGLSPDYESTCGEFARGPDVTMLWTAPADGTYAFDLSDSAYDTVLHTYDYAGTCGEGLRECDDDSGTTTRSRIETDMRAGEPILLIIDGYNTASGSYVLDIDVVP